MFVKNPARLFCLALLGVALLPGCSHREAVRDVPVLPIQTPADAPVTPESIEAEIPPEPPPLSAVLTLDRATDEALAASPELEQIKRRIEAASEQVRQAESLFYPKLTVMEDYGLTNEPGQAFMYIINQRRFRPTINFNKPGVQQDFTTRVQGEIQFFAGGADWYGRKASQARQRAVSAEFQAARNQLVSKVSETYLKWLQAMGFIAVAQRALESAEVSEEIGVARVRAQTALPSEVTRLKVHTAEARSNLVSAKTGTRRLQAAIERLIARPLNPDETPPPDSEPRRPSREPPAGGQKELVDHALRYRPEAASAAALIEAARERVRASQSGFLPKISANAFREVNSEGFGNMPDSWFAGIHASWPIFEGGASMSRMREAKAHLKEMEARGRQVALDIALEVRQASLAVEEAMEKVQVSEARKQWADEALSDTRRLYRNQVAAIDALLQAEVASNRADVAYTAALFDRKIARTALMQALGAFTDWTEKQE